MSVISTIKLQVVIQDTPATGAEPVSGVWFIFHDKSGLLCKLSTEGYILFTLKENKLECPFLLTHELYDIIPIELKVSLQDDTSRV